MVELLDNVMECSFLVGPDVFAQGSSFDSKTKTMFENSGEQGAAKVEGCAAVPCLLVLPGRQDSG